MQLGERIYESAMTKGDLLTFFQELTKALKINANVVEQTFHACSWETKTYNLMTRQACLPGPASSQSHPATSLEGTLPGTVNLCH